MRITRRDFVRTSSTAVAAAAVAPAVLAQNVHASGSDRIRVGLVGCGGRGTGAAIDCARSAPGIEIVALGDVFEDRIAECRKKLEVLGDKLQVADERCFSGFDNYQHVIHSDVDLVILVTPPGFRPAHLRAAVDAGRHVFMEKPVAVDPTGVRSVFESADIAAAKGLGVVAGTQRRHHAGYLECIERIHDGEIGEIVSAAAYWIGGELWVHERKPEWTDMEYQLRNWLYYTWLSGDHVVEQHIHNLDVMNWVLGSHPTKCSGLGGRQKRTAPQYGHIYDHFAIEYEYPGGVRVSSKCRQSDNCHMNVSELVVGTKGRSNCCTSIQRYNGRGLFEPARGAAPASSKQVWKYEWEEPRPYVQEHTDLIQSIRSGQPLNEARQVAESTLTAIMGREAAYTGKEITWDHALNAKQDLSPTSLEFGPLEAPEVPVPGKTEFA